MSIFIDVHEDPVYANKLKQLGIPVEVKSLPIGDIWIGKVIIEHKKIDDFFQSVTDGRYYKQLYNMMCNCTKENKMKSMVYITGNMPNYVPQVRGKGGKLVPINLDRALRTHKIISFYSFGVPVFQVVNDDEYIKEILAYYERSGRNQPALKPIDVKRKASTPYDIRVNIYGSIPNVGRNAANYLARRYTIKQIQKLSLDQLKAIKIGDKKLGKRAENIYNIFNT